MKWLVSIGVLQLLFIALLVFRLDAMESRVASLSATERSASVIGERMVQTGALAVPTGASYGLDEDELRQVISEELNAILSAPRNTADSESEVALSHKADPLGNETTANHYQSDLVRGELDYYTSKGAISGSEMAGLQWRIASLPAQERTRMLRELARALSSGGLQGRL